MSFSPPPLIHATAESVKTEIIPCTLLNGFTGELELIRCGRVITTRADVFRQNVVPARIDYQIAQIPADYVPAVRVTGVAVSNYAVGYIEVTTEGKVIFRPSGEAMYSIMFSPLTWVIPD